MVDDAELDDAIAAARGGDRDALGLVWRRWNAPLQRYLNVRGAPAPEDLAADVWIEVARGLARFTGGSDAFPRWLFTIARRRLTDEFRRNSNRAAVVDGDLVAGASVDECSPETIVAERDSVDRAVALVRSLPPDQAEAVLLRVVAGLDVAEAAEVMGRSAGAVRVLAHRGLRRLAEMSAGAVTDGAPTSIEGVR